MLGVPMQRSDVRDFNRNETGSAKHRSEAPGRICAIADRHDISPNNAGTRPLDRDSHPLRDQSGDRDQWVCPVARQQDQRAVGPQHPPTLAECRLRIHQVFHDKVGIHDVKGGILERQCAAQVVGRKAIQSAVLCAGSSVEVHSDKPGNPVAVSRQAGPPPAADVQNARTRNKRPL